MVTANIRDVAALAKVSVGTVSNVLNKSKKVSPATESRVTDAIEALGFVRNDAARQLRVGQSRTVGMMVLDVRNPFFTDVARGVEETLAAHARSLILGNSAEDAQRELDYLDLFEEQRVSGLLITPVGDVAPRLERLRKRGSPVVLVDRYEGAANFSSVSADDRRGGALALEHLIGIGRVRTAFVGGPQAIMQVRHRLEGARTALEAAGGGPLRVVEMPTMSAEAGRTAGEQLLDLPIGDRPDAIFAANDLLALGVLQALTHSGLSVPDDIALIGYDDIYFAASSAIPLSSIRQPAQAMGRAAAELLIAEIEDGPPAHYEHVLFQPELVIRDSTRRNNAATRAE
ncbi:LacI family transcriptional regulator [Glaciihabitans tibetensis]|uniref:LacI family transcriptional regulator n=1 Tax=Glaciihabitans tibetensis TaxID=1266600 RepID=A0A2T0V9V0_9MICO|nr:LacI family DNA-binding transcriptional regulator [Glaciihabitans tibetensis]PRY66924.1 LacI family transcriptional regulator [Glaciihabitans tibetensis]